MKSIKMLGLAALAALMAMAFVGASSASAESTQLCTGDPASSCGTAIHHVHEATLAGSQAVLKTSFLTIKCDVLFLGDVTSSNNLGNPLVVTGTDEVVGGWLTLGFAYTNCNNSCVVREENGPAEIKVLRLGHETADVTGESLVHMECGAFIDCLYNHIGILGTAKGPLLSTETNGELRSTEQSLNEEGGSFFCPDTAKLTIVTTPLSATYIGS